MTPRLLINISVVSKDTIFLNRLKTSEMMCSGGFNFIPYSNQKSPADLFLIDAELLELFLSDYTGVEGIKFIVRGHRKLLRYSFDAGCVDFLRIPVDLDELEIRIRKVFDLPVSSLVWDELNFTPTTLSQGTRSVNITLEEYTVLKTLIQNRGEAVPREVFAFFLWGSHKDGSRAVDMHISHLRKKISSISRNSLDHKYQIITVRTLGYMIY